MKKILLTSLVIVLIINNLLSQNSVVQENNSMQLIFVYNAKSGFLNGVFDYIHKFVSPHTYSCNLCSITYDNIGKKNEWSKYLNSLPINIIFAYKDNLYNYIKNIEINNLKNLNELILLMNKKLPKYKLTTH